MATGPDDHNTTQVTSRNRVERIPPAYYKTLDPLEWWKYALTGVALVVSVVWVAYGFVVSPRQHSPGPVASVHAPWSADCKRCHTPGQPTSGDSSDFFGDGKRHAAQLCSECHQGWAHHSNFAARGNYESDAAFLAAHHEEPGCASCHQDHRGVDANLSLMHDSRCTQCHQDLLSHADKRDEVNRGKKFPIDRITSFAVEHPRFNSIPEKDPGKLKFSHARHNMPGQVLTLAGSEHQKRLRDLPERYRKQYYAKQPGESGEIPEKDLDLVVQLQCASCHESDATAGGIPTYGDYMQPIDFERHCAACHQQTYAPVGNAYERETMPHGLQPDAMRRIVEGVLAEWFVRVEPMQTSEPADRLGIPGRSQTDNSDETKQTAAFINEHISAPASFLRDRCLQCHSFVGPEPQNQGSPLERALEPTNVPSLWLKNERGAPTARFDHHAHRLVACVGCHAEASKTWEERNKVVLDDSKPMIPGYDNCRQCHARVSAGGQGVRSDCVACHRYHGSDLMPGFNDRNFPGVTTGLNLKRFTPPKPK